ncbi:MAG: hypothetical protein AB1489_35800, partial [Acidobacteriota bacterium]
YQDHDIVHEAVSFEVLPADVFGTGQLPPALAGPIYWPAGWSLQVGEGGALRKPLTSAVEK